MPLYQIEMSFDEGRSQLRVTDRAPTPGETLLVTGTVSHILDTVRVRGARARRRGARAPRCQPRGSNLEIASGLR
jgi:hypothetical protein